MKPYQRYLMPFSKLTITLLSLFIVQGCSLISDKSENTPLNENAGIKSAEVKVAEIKEIGQSILDMGADMGDIPASTPKTVANSSSAANTGGAISQSLPIKNKLYQQFLAQQALMQNNVPSATKAHYQLALNEMKSENWPRATVLLNEIIEESPKLSAAYLNKALAQYYLKQFDSAMLTLQAAEKINAINPYIYNLQGVIAREQGNFIAAESHYEKALVLWPDYPEAHLNAAVLFELYRGEFIKAKAHYEAYLVLKPDDKQTKRWLAGLEIKLASRKDS